MINRRNFFSRLFGGNKPKEMGFLGIQVAFNYYGKETLRSEIHHIINAPVDDEETPAEKKRIYRKIVMKLLEAEPYYEYGFWDFIPDAARAESEFRHWVNDIEANLALEEDEVADEVDGISRLSANKYYVVVSLCFLLEASAMLDRFVETVIDDIPEEEYMTRETFARLIAAINQFDFEYCYGDAVYIMPGNEKDGISYEDLLGEGWEYLKMIS
ncbi:MAG: hypothetical protein HY22_04910 [[Candidatus Thermochlorobacteriaceae] bacterium GBChlB]|nr:MAG: hypothetical protein HY22_04910 [[Candidatus Thermochlorobacteriaceae] bacterium GBChlB]